MSEIQQQQASELPVVVESPKSQPAGVLSSWKFKAGFIATGLVVISLGLFLLVFFWEHTVAGMGMKDWSSRAHARPIECMIKDTNSDGYVSCSAMLEGEVVPLECGSSIFNIGCRVNYGTAASPPTKVR